jgi:ferredoxin hydrogenase small subunit
MALLDTGSAGLNRLFGHFGIRFLWHPSLSVECGAEVHAVLDDVTKGRVRLDALCVEGAVLRGPDGSGCFHMMSGTGRSMASWVTELAGVARHTLAIGSCAAYGGIPSAGANSTDACGLQFLGSKAGGLLGENYRSVSGLPVINVAGCAPHPGWITETLIILALGDFTARDVDAYARPSFFANHLAHHGCSRNEFYEFKASAKHFSERGCLMENLGCRATQAPGDCNLRTWNGGGSCTNAGFSCIACTSPGFERTAGFLTTPKVAGIPVGLPVDMPKAWFVALAALSKSATPERVKRNAAADHVVVPPTRSADEP